MKNLLEPEVGLATSMLQTLREATEEEYRDAIARDAARSSDTVPEESARNVVIIVKPRGSGDEDDFVSEASNVKESRCIKPLGSPLGKMRTVSKPLKTVPDFFRLSTAKQPNFMPRNLWDIDSNLEASSVQEKILGTDGEAAEFKPRSALFKLRTPLKENTLKSSIVGDVLKTPSVFDKLEQTLKNRPNVFERFNLPLIPKMKVDSPLRKDIDPNNDLRPAPSNIQELIEKEDDKGRFKLNKRPLMLRNLLKLKDVELVPTTIPRIPITKSKLNTKDIDFTPLSRDTDGNTKCEDTHNDSDMNEKVLLPEMVSPEGDDTFEANNIPNIASIEPKEDHQDATTSPSETIPNILDNTQTINIESDNSECNDLSSEDIMPTTPDDEVILKVLEDSGLNDTLDPVVESEITDNVDNSNTSKHCETDEFSENGAEDAEPDMDSANNIKNIASFTSRENFILQPPIQELDAVARVLSENDRDDFTSNQDIPDNTQKNIEPKSEVINKKITPNINPIPPLSETLLAIKDNVKKSLKNLKKTTVSPVLPQENTKFSTLKADTPIVEDLDSEPRNDEFVEDRSENKENLFQVTFNDLQKLSDDLLILNSNSEQNIIPKEAAVENETSMLDFKQNAGQEKSDEIEPESLTEPTTTTEFVIPKEANLISTKEKGCRADFADNKANQKSAQESISVIRNEDKKDMSVEASVPVASTVPAHLDPLNPSNLNEQLGASLLQLNSLDPLNLNEKLGSRLIQNFDPLNIKEKLRSPVFTEITPLEINEPLTSPLLSNLNPLNLNEKLGTVILDPLNLGEKLESIFQPNLDSLNVKSLQDIIVQPTIPDNPLKFLGKPIAEVIKLPTFEDLRETLSSVFDNNDRSAENNFSDEDGDCINVAPVEMTPAASSTSSRKIPSIRPLEAMNVDIFQLNPLSKPDSLSSVPGLNLNNFRAKLPIPNNLELKPVKLESRVANNKGNVLGAALTFSNDKAFLRKPKLNHSNLLGRPIGTLPSLDELRSTFQSGTHNLLAAPLQPNLDLFKDSNLRASGIPDIDEIRRNAEKTMKGLHQRMKSTLKGGNINPLSEKFAKPQDLLEDVNDKLKAIHFDLNDRLSSIHEDILDQSRLKDLAIPVLPSFLTNRNANTNIMNNIRGKPARLQTSASTISAQEIGTLDNRDKTLLRSPARSSKRVQAKDKTLLGAESAPAAAKVEFSKPQTTIATPRKLTLPPLPLLPSLKQGSENAFPQNFRENSSVFPRQGFVKDLKKPILRKPSPFKDKNGKVTITFSTTTASPVTSPVKQFKTTTPSMIADKPSVNINPISDSLNERLALPRSKTFGDGRQSASELKPSTILTPVTSKNNFKTANSLKTHQPQLQNLDSIENTKSRLSSFNGIKDSKSKLNEQNANKLNSAWAYVNNKPEAKNTEVAEKTKAKSLVWPKTGEDSFLAKVKQAMQARLNSFQPAKTAEKVEVAKVESPNTDMLRSASEKNDVIVKEPLQENVSYKCKMLCTRE